MCGGDKGGRGQATLDWAGTEQSVGSRAVCVLFVLMTRRMNEQVFTRRVVG